MTLHAPFDPQYDPLIDATPGCGRAYAPTYWIDTAGDPPDDDGILVHDSETEVVVVGSGFTGLCTAIFLAQEHNIQVTVLEANRASWGCSVRNGGQAQFAAGRLSRSQWIARYGEEVALQLHKEMLDGFATFRDLIADIACDPQNEGHLYIAHNEKAVAKLKREVSILQNVFGYDASLLTVSEIHEKYVQDAEAHGAMKEVDGIGIHPAKLAFGYLQKARRLGVKVHTSSPVIGVESDAEYHTVITPKARVRAQRVAFCTGGYTSNHLHARLRNKIMPILSNSLVTRVLTDDEIAACRLRTHAAITDTRILRHYYRFLPDKRIQIGGRSAIGGRHAAHEKFKQILYSGLIRKFPVLDGIQIDYYWWGWVDVSHDMMPRITASSNRRGVFYALGYGGNGVMYSAQAGRRLAQCIAGVQLPKLPIFGSDLPYPRVLDRFESQFFAPFRRFGQRMLYRWYAIEDEWLK